MHGKAMRKKTISGISCIASFDTICVPKFDFGLKKTVLPYSQKFCKTDMKIIAILQYKENIL